MFCIFFLCSRLIASQAKAINQFKNLRTKVAKCSANIYFNQQCLHNKIIPKYAQLKVPNTSPASQSTAQKARIMRIEEELKFLYKKKEILNRELYRRHLEVAQEYGWWWNVIHDSLLQKINTEMERKYKSMGVKIKRLTQNQAQKPKADNNFYPKAVKNTSINFSDEEMELLNKGLKYNLGSKQKRWINNLAMEAKTAIMMLPPGQQDYIRHQVAKNIKRLYQQHGQRTTYKSTQEKRQDKTAKLIKDKLIKNKAMVAKADKGNSTVILYSDDYTQKVNDFIFCGNFTTANACITKNLQRELRDKINECRIIIQKDDKVETYEYKPHSTNHEGPDKSSQRRRPHQTSR